MPRFSTGQKSTPGDADERRRQGTGLLRTLYVTARRLALISAVLATTLLVSAMIGAVSDRAWLRIGAGLFAGLLIPLLVRGRLRSTVARRLGSRQRLGGSWFVVGCNIIIISVICLGFSDEAGRSLRRRGDWFLGRASGKLPERVRGKIRSISRYLEKWDLPPAARTVLADARRPRPPRSGTDVLPGERPVSPVFSEAAWFHPLAGPGRMMPRYSVCRFGASRKNRRYPECGLGHCGVDLGRPIGTLTHAVHDGLVLRAVRRETIGRGRYVILAHKNGQVNSVYIHLDSVAAHLRPGVKVRGGEVIGTVGTTGLRRHAPHLHFALRVRHRNKMRHIDPEPLLHFWRLPVSTPPRPKTVARRAGLSPGQL